MTEPSQAAGAVPVRPLHRIDLESALSVDAKGPSKDHGAARMTYQGQPIGQSTEPLYEAARYLLKHRLADPDDRIATFRNGAMSMTSTVGRAVDTTILENSRVGPVRRAFRSWPRIDVKKPIRSPAPDRQTAVETSGDQTTLFPPRVPR